MADIRELRYHRWDDLKRWFFVFHRYHSYSTVADETAGSDDAVTTDNCRIHNSWRPVRVCNDIRRSRDKLDESIESSSWVIYLFGCIVTVAVGVLSLITHVVTENRWDAAVKSAIGFINVVSGAVATLSLKWKDKYLDWYGEANAAQQDLHDDWDTLLRATASESVERGGHIGDQLRDDTTLSLTRCFGT